MSEQESQSKYSQQIKREKLDPGEGMRPLPWIVTLLLGAMFMWGAFYIVISPTGGQSSYGDQRTIATLKPKSAAAEVSQVDGKQVYIGKCAACHQANGLGLPGVFPPLADAEWVKDDPAILVNILLHGINGEMKVKGVSYKGAMPAWNMLSDAEIAAVSTYIRSDWGNKESAITEEAVKKQRELTKVRQEPYKNGEEIKSGT
jgi:mono/diheme cytochrome c family protein